MTQELEIKFNSTGGTITVNHAIIECGKIGDELLLVYMDLKNKYANIDIYGRDEDYPSIGIYPYNEKDDDSEINVTIVDFPELKGYNVEIGMITRYTCKLTLKKISDAN